MARAAQLIRLVCWNEDLTTQREKELRSAGFRVEASPMRGASGIIRHFREINPAATIIDLDRLPSHGREIAIALRASKTTRHIPIVFAGGAEEKAARLRAELPDAVFTPWNKIAAALKSALASPPIAPVQPVPHIQRWSNSSLTKKLGITADMSVAWIGSDEDGLDEIIGELPEGASLSKRITSGTGLVLYTVHSLRELDAAVDHAGAHLPEGASFWIIHLKTAAKQHTDFNQNDVRELALSRGFVDYKVCSVDARWSGLKFTRRKKAARKPF